MVYVFLFSGSIKDNISMKNENITLDEIKEATEQLGLGEFINSFPENYDYILNERGNNLSLGQAQLISFIRAIVTNPDILILDEATSSIDPHTESLVQQAIEKLIKNRTSITIAHRHIAWDIDIRQKMHLYFFHTITLAGLTAATGYVKAESTRAIATLFGQIHFCH